MGSKLLSITEYKRRKEFEEIEKLTAFFEELRADLECQQLVQENRKKRKFFSLSTGK